MIAQPKMLRESKKRGRVLHSRCSRGIYPIWLSLLTAVAAFLALAGPAEARNVPGSAAAVQSRIDHAVASSVLDTAVMTARDAALFNACQDYVKDPAPGSPELRDPCQWGISFGGGLQYLEGSPNGFDFDFRSTHGSLTIAHAVSPATTLLVALIAESGSGDLEYNRGTLENSGVGILGGVIFRLNDRLDLSFLGGAEWLNYETSRSSNLYSGDYDATRYMFDTRLRGLSGLGPLFVEYSGGLRFIQQRNDAYEEYSGGAPFASVPSTSFSVLTGLGDIKIGKQFADFTPYVQVSGYLNFFEDSDFAASFEAFGQSEQSVSGRLGAGVDMVLPAGRLSLTGGVFASQDGFQGADFGIKLSKLF